jgi:hypothetical protein
LRARELYVDSLAVLQALLGRFSLGPNAATIEDPALVENVIDTNLPEIATVINASTQIDPNYRKTISQNVTETLDSNRKTALELYEECLNPTRASRTEVFDLADKYVRALVEQYIFFRYPNRQSLEEPELKAQAAGG